MAKTTKQARLTKGERAIREALTSQGRPLPGTPEDEAWIRGRDWGEKRALEKAKQSTPAASPEAPDARPKFSRGMALLWLDGVDEQFSNIASLAIGGRAYQETRAEDYKDPVMLSFLRVIQQQTDDSTQASNELRKMLETLPMEAHNG
jgi:hypothetical protein